LEKYLEGEKRPGPGRPQKGVGCEGVVPKYKKKMKKRTSRKGNRWFVLHVGSPIMEDRKA